MVPLAHTCQLSCVPGDLGDARFNGVMLEHFHRWLTGLEPSLTSPPFFYPMPGASAFSDNHWGTAWIYSLIRQCGADRYLAFDLWYLVGFVATFVVSHVVFRRMHFSPLASALAAFAFTFAMPVISRHGHAQLTYRFLIPVGLLLWQRCIDDGRWRWFALLSVVVGSQFYMSIYLGYFLLLLLSAWWLAGCGVDRLWPTQWLLRWWQGRKRSTWRELLVSLLVAAATMTALIVLMYPYVHYSDVYGFGRGLGEVASLTPRPQSYLLADQSLIWGGISSHVGQSVPMRHEQQLFFGLGIIGLAVLGVRYSRARMRWVALVSLGLLVALTLTFGRYSLYLAIATLPGAESVRAVARIGLVMALPLALLVGMAVDAMPRLQVGMRVLIGLLVVAMMAESALHQTTHFSFEEARARTVAARGQLPASLPAGAVLFIPASPDVPFYVSELDAMVLAQELGHPTLNGYSGNVPPGYLSEPERPPCAQAVTRLRAARRFARRQPDVLLQQPVPSAAVVSGQARCSVARLSGDVAPHPSERRHAR
ncbi:hypothetical protein [Stenotrophomonas sp.]|uniref:hypothetical protein n=1 Tax=Stenotrophomonas sp. TaxID=69392 RepID=UPI0028A7B577|nr:hypothetical protein [Stenotrophomonas sp.]